MRLLRLIIVVTLMAVPRVAAADPFALTGGALFIQWDGYASSFTVSAAGFSAGGGANGPASYTGFNVGQAVDLSETYTFTPLTPVEEGGFTLNGTHENAFIMASFDIVAVPFVAGDFPNGHTFTTPFALTGLLRAFANPLSSTEPQTPFFTAEVTGSGIASISPSRYNTTNPDYLNRNTLIFTITAPAAATPEPASLALLGSGLLGMIGAARRRAHKGRVA